MLAAAIGPGALIGVAVVGGLVGAVLGSSKGKVGLGFVLGLLLGPIGWIIIAVTDPTPGLAAERQHAIAAAGGTGTLDRYEQLDRLQRLRTSGAIDDGEYLDQKRRVPPVDLTADWKPDPWGHHPDRYWDGARWTEWVRDAPGGTRGEDPV